jgi:hypothetical protein
VAFFLVAFFAAIPFSFSRDHSCCGLLLIENVGLRFDQVPSSLGHPRKSKRYSYRHANRGISLFVFATLKILSAMNWIT